MEKDVKGKVWRWTLVGVAVGGGLGVLLAGVIGGVIGGIVVGILTYRSCAKNGGKAPAWLWRSKENKQ